MSDIILNNFQIDTEGEADGLDEVTLHQALTNRIAQMLDIETDLLFSTLYRLDVLEYKIKAVLAGNTGENIPAGLARLVIERQKEKMKTRKSAGTPPDFEDF
jgi:hypothetical protein